MKTIIRSNPPKHSENTMFFITFLFLIPFAQSKLSSVGELPWSDVRMNELDFDEKPLQIPMEHFPSEAKTKWTDFAFLRKGMRESMKARTRATVTPTTTRKATTIEPILISTLNHLEKPEKQTSALHNHHEDKKTHKIKGRKQAEPEPESQKTFQREHKTRKSHPFVTSKPIVSQYRQYYHYETSTSNRNHHPILRTFHPGLYRSSHPMFYHQVPPHNFGIPFTQYSTRKPHQVKGWAQPAFQRYSSFSRL